MSGEYLNATDTAENPVIHVEVKGFPEIENLVNENIMNGNQEVVLDVLNKPENESLKQGLENFLSTETNVIKINVFKSKLSKATDELTIKSVIAEVVKAGYKISGEQNGGGDTGDGENILDLENGLQQAENDEATAENKILATENKILATENKILTTENKEKKERNIVNIEQMTLKKEEDLELRRELLEGHEAVKKITEEKAKLAQQQLPEETRNQLKAEGYDDNFINDYILLRVTVNEVKGSPDFDENKVAQFESSVNELSTLDVILKRLDNACNIPDTSLSSFSTENIAQTRTELFNEDIGNESLRQTKKTNLKSRDYKDMLPEMENSDKFEKYGQFLQGDLKRCWEEYKGNYLGFVEKYNSVNEKKSRGEKLTTDEQNILNLEGAIKGIKDKIDNDTKNMVEELCIISQIKGMYMCMGEGDDFNLNKAKNIRYDKQGAMILDGHVDGVAFSIRQDINSSDAKLQTSKKLAKTSDKKTFVVGGKDTFVDSNFILPSQKEIFKTISKTVVSGVSVEDFDNQDDYLESLQSCIMGAMDEKYEDTKYVHHYMQDQVKGEKVVDNTLGLIAKIDSDITNNETLLSAVNETTNKDLYEFLKILNFNIENSTDYEKDKLNWCIDEIGRIIDNYQNSGKSSGVYPQEVSEYLENDTWVNGSKREKLLLVFSMFNHFHEKPSDRVSIDDDGSQLKVIINDLYVQLHDKPQEKRNQEQEQMIRNIETNQVYAELMDVYDESPEMA